MLRLIADRNLNGGQERQRKRRRRDRAKVRKRGKKGEWGWMGTSRLGNLFVKNAPLIPEEVLKKKKSAQIDKTVMSRGSQRE